jgi:hypothetical protein
MSAHHTASQGGPALRNSIDTLPVEVVNQILSYLIHPRSRLPGLTEAQSHHTVSGPTRMAIRSNEEFTTSANTDPWAANLFTISFTQHPFNALANTSRRCHELVESYTGHLVRICNPFNLPFAHFDQHGSNSVWPDLSGIVYRRLWLQHEVRLLRRRHRPVALSRAQATGHSMRTLLLPPDSCKLHIFSCFVQTVTDVH